MADLKPVEEKKPEIKVTTTDDRVDSLNPHPSLAVNSKKNEETTTTVTVLPPGKPCANPHPEKKACCTVF